MAIKKQEFYEGAALHRLVCSGGLKEISFEAPLFLLNNHTAVYFKHSAKNRSPWGFTFAPEECRFLEEKIHSYRLIAALICGFDGVAVIECAELLKIGHAKDSPVHIACFRRHGEYYKVSGPSGELSKKVAPSEWTRLLSTS